MMLPLGYFLRGLVAIMALAACFMARKTLRTFVRRVLMNWSGVMAEKGTLVPTMPAFANMMSRRPYLDTASSMTAFRAVSSLASKRRAWISTLG